MEDIRGSEPIMNYSGLNRPIISPLERLRISPKNSESNKILPNRASDSLHIPDGSIFGLGVSQQNRSKSPNRPLSQQSKFARGKEEYIFKRKQVLQQAFREADVNSDGILSPQELKDFLDKQSQKNGFPEFSFEIFQILVSKVDKNRDGKITIEEFIEYYIDGELRIRKKQNECVKQMAERVDRRQQTEQRLEQINNTEKLNKFGIMDSSKIKIKCFEAQDLVLKSDSKISKALRDGILEPQAMFQVGQSIIVSQINKNQDPVNPVWGQEFEIAIYKDTEPLYISIIGKDVNGETLVIGRQKVELRSFLGDQLVHDEWIRLKSNDMQPNGLIHVSLQWIYSEVQFCIQAIKTFNEAIQLHEKQLENLNNHLTQYRMPFKMFADEDSSGVEDEKAYISNMNDPQWRQVELFEADLVSKMDPITSELAQNMGYNSLPQFVFKCLTYVTLIYLSLSILQSIERPDFLNLTLGCISVYFLSNRDILRKQSFRNLVLGMILSFGYDSYWIYLEWNDFEASTEEDGQNPEKQLKIFSFQVAIISLMFRIVVIASFWRASVDFKTFVKKTIIE